MNTARRGPALFQSLGARRLSLVLAIALGIGGLVAACLWPGLTHAHGAAAKMVPLKKTLEDFGATVRFDRFSNVFTISRNSTLVRVKPGSREALVNGAPLQLDVPVILRKGKPFVSSQFANQVFQSSLDKTFVVERKPSPLNPLTEEEIKATVDVLKAGNVRAGLSLHRNHAQDAAQGSGLEQRPGRPAGRSQPAVHLHDP